MRHESQTIVISKLRKLIETIEALPEGTVVSSVHASRWLEGGLGIQLLPESFAEMFAGQEVDIYDGDLGSIFVGEVKFYSTVRRQQMDGPYVMPALATVPDLDDTRELQAFPDEIGGDS